jgi:hypothetical protein
VENAVEERRYVTKEDMSWKEIYHERGYVAMSRYPGHHTKLQKSTNTFSFQQREQLRQDK